MSQTVNHVMPTAAHSAAAACKRYPWDARSSAANRARRRPSNHRTAAHTATIMATSARIGDHLIRVLRLVSSVAWPASTAVMLAVDVLHAPTLRAASTLWIKSSMIGLFAKGIQTVGAAKVTSLPKMLGCRSVSVTRWGFVRAE